MWILFKNEPDSGKLNWVINASKCANIMLFDDSIKFYWTATKADTVSFDSDEEAKAAFDKIINSLKNNIYYLEI